jgi:hypothetical protein
MNPSRRSIISLCALLAVMFLLGPSAPAQTGPIGVVSPTSLTFQTLVGQTSPPQRVSLKNTGDAELTITSISISGDFALPTNHCAAGVKPGTHCDVYVTFTPKALETETGTLTFTDNASNSPQTVSLTGTGVSMAATKTHVTATPKSIYTGQTVTITATVTSSGGVIPNGEQVLFPDQGLSAPLQAGVATLTTPLYSGYDGKGKIVAQYPGDQTFYPSQGVFDVIVSRYDTETTITSNPNPSVYGQPITFTSVVTPAGPFAATGVLLDIFSSPKGVPPKRGGTYVYYYLTDVGSFEVEAEYKGDPNNKPSNSSMTQVINPTPTTTTITSSKNPSKQGQAVTFVIVMETPYQHADKDEVVVEGSVTLTSGGNTLGEIELKGNRGAIKISSLPVGQNTITATYSGGGNFLGSSVSLVQTVQ